MKSFSTTHTTTKFDASYTGIKSSSIPYTEIKSIWTTHKMQDRLITLKSSDFRPVFKNQVNSTTHTATKLISCHTEIKSYSIPRNEINSMRTNHTKTKLFFLLILKTKWFSASIRVTNQFIPPARQPNQLQHNTEINSSSPPHTEIKPISTTITKTKSISMLTLKISNFRQAHKDKVNFDPRTENYFGLHTETKSIPTPTQVNFDPHSKNKSILHAPGHENQANFDPDSIPSHFRPSHKTRSIMTHTLKSSQLRSPTLKSRLFRLPTKRPSQFLCQH